MKQRKTNLPIRFDLSVDISVGVDVPNTPLIQKSGYWLLVLLLRQVVSNRMFTIRQSIRN